MEIPGRKRLGGQAAIGLTMAVALLSVATGVINIDQGGSFGPLAPLLPTAIKSTAGFTGALTGFMMVVSAVGMRRGLRAAWYSTLVLLPITAGQGLVQASPYSLPLVVASIIAFPVVVLNHRRFDREIQLSTTQIAAALALIGVQAYGTVGTYALRSEFNSVNGLLDAFYYTLVTASTVGYGDATPATGQARLFGMSVVVLGTASFGIAIGALLAPAIEARFVSALGKMTQSQLESLEHHVIVAGYGELTESVLNELRAGNRDFVVLTTDSAHANELAERGINVVTADPSDEESLERAGLDRADALVAATNDDGEDALTILTARQLNPDVRIVAAATDQENEAKFRRAGANVVISPAVLGGRLLVQSALGSDHAESLAESMLEEEDGDEDKIPDDITSGDQADKEP